ncbi:hypothetical protein [Anaerobranca gottschalkii]|uniref:Uncharacterized protein n=1 Tax=Anaerobranca gottschalkii DSM 13577 TaxID=1120990 RepID=A0A1H9YDA5_9FIRM|nr:hypothetical protein [Anaerobranca gottschalkii]SES66950.1 hypothetical protein SAMN03080614_1002130 [Anaerobranca gottschalkii DSM 13577]
MNKKAIISILLVVFIILGLWNIRGDSKRSEAEGDLEFFGGELMSIEYVILDDFAYFGSVLIINQRIDKMDVIGINGTNIDGTNFSFELSDLLDTYKGFYIYDFRIDIVDLDENENFFEVKSVDLKINNTDLNFPLNKVIFYRTNNIEQGNLYGKDFYIDGAPVTRNWDTEQLSYRIYTNKAIDIKNISFTNQDIQAENLRFFNGVKVTENGLIPAETEAQFSFDLVKTKNINNNTFLFTDIIIEYIVVDTGEKFYSHGPMLLKIGDISPENIMKYIDKR